MATWTQEEYDALRAAVASGVLTVKYAGPPAREITYQSLSDMRALLAEMAASIADQNGGATRFRRAAFRKGFRDADD